jgi:6-phospho-3-hexuloisomerase
MEKSGERYDMLPIRFAFPNQELFACIDDDLNTEGYSLVSRGVYKKVGTGFSTVERIEQILTEIKTVLTKVDQAQVDTLVRDILAARRIIASGAGRVGMAVRGFVMRLKHLGLDAYILGDANVPSLKEQDLFLVCSGSGETQTIFELTAIANRNQAKIALITGNPASRIGKLAQTIVEIRAPSKTKQVEGFASIQPMTTLNEQSIGIFFDAVVLRLMEELNETHETMWERHSNLE